MSTAATALALTSPIQPRFERIKDATKATEAGTAPDYKGFPIQVHQPKRLNPALKKNSTEQCVRIWYQISFRTRASPLPLGTWSFTVAKLPEAKEMTWLCSWDVVYFQKLIKSSSLKLSVMDPIFKTWKKHSPGTTVWMEKCRGGSLCSVCVLLTSKWWHTVCALDTDCSREFSFLCKLPKASL